MADFLWALSTTQLPDALFDWQRVIYGLQVPRAAQATQTLPHLAVWTFRGDQPLAAGYAALFAEYFRWIGPTFSHILTRYEEDRDGLLPWTSDLMQIDPETFTPEEVAAYPKVWGELATDRLDVHYAYQDQTQDWTLTGDAAQIATQLIDLVPDVMMLLGVDPTYWQPDEPLDLDAPDALAGLLRTWGELNIRHELTQVGYDEYADALAGAIRRLETASLTGSRFACWLACRALWPVATDADAPHQADAEDTLVSLGSAFPRVAWPGIALSLLEWARGDYNRAADLLETAVESDPLAIQGWQLLALVYEELGQPQQAIKVYREAISGNVADATIYYDLGRLLLDQSESGDENVDRVAIEEAQLMLSEAGHRGLHTPELALRQMDAAETLEDDRALWAAFAKLIDTDTDGDTLWQVIEDADTYPDFEPGLALLSQAAAAAPDKYEVLAVYIRALIVLDRHTDAQQTLPTLRQVATDDYARAETALLALEAAAPDFEDAYAEIADNIEYGALPDSSAISLLTDALSREPDFADGAVALAHAYHLLDQPDEGLAVLNAARERLPDHLELVLSSADLLWETDQDDLALWTMQEALSRTPDDVALLARLGEYYFEIKEDNLARDFLRRAESLDPRHPELVRVREQISRGVGDRSDEEEAYADEEP